MNKYKVTLGCGDCAKMIKEACSGIEQYSEIVAQFSAGKPVEMFEDTIAHIRCLIFAKYQKNCEKLDPVLKGLGYPYLF